MPIVKSLDRRAILLTVAVLVAAMTWPAAEPASASSGSCLTTQVCLARATYTNETSGTAMYGFPELFSSWYDFYFGSYVYPTGTDLYHSSWRIRNRMGDGRKACTYNNINLNNLNFVEYYSTTLAWDYQLPDDLTASFRMQDPNGFC